MYAIRSYYALDIVRALHAGLDPLLGLGEIASGCNQSIDDALGRCNGERGVACECHRDAADVVVELSSVNDPVDETHRERFVRAEAPAGVHRNNFV